MISIQTWSLPQRQPMTSVNKPDLWKTNPHTICKRLQITKTSSEFWRLSRLFQLENISCGYSLELSRRDDSNEHPQNMFWSGNMEKNGKDSTNILWICSNDIPEKASRQCYNLSTGINETRFCLSAKPHQRLILLMSIYLPKLQNSNKQILVKRTIIM